MEVLETAISPGALGLYMPIHVIVFSLLTHSFWKNYRELPKERRFNFYILDMLAATVCLAPTLWLFTAGIKMLQAGDTQIGAIYFCLTFIALSSQLCGVLIGRIHYAFPPSKPVSSQWVQAGWVLAGGMGGLLLASASLLITASIVSSGYR